MKSKLALLAVACALCSVCLGQWSEPIDVGVDTALHYVDDFQFAMAGGDTLWAFYSVDNGWPDMSCAFAHWSMGDSWSDARVLVADTFVYCLAAGTDAQDRVWLSWYNGTYYTDDDSWGICTRVHDSLGWGPERQALPGPGSVGQSFAVGKQGDWYMGICVQYAPLPGLCTSALYSMFQGDTWIWPHSIAEGSGSPLFIDYGLPLMVARPDSGLWAVCSHSTYGVSEILIDQVLPDTIRRLASLDCGGSYAATGDSSGHMWIVYLDSSGALWSATFSQGGMIDQRIVTTDRRWSAPMVCTDPLGWVWTCWTRPDTILVVSYNRGNGWSPPEAVTESYSIAADITSDRNGRIYVGLHDRRGRCLTCYRSLRPSIEETANGDGRMATGAATVVRSLPPGAVAFDAMGRRVVSAKPGVYFVRNEGRGEGDLGRARKVVVQR